MSFYVIKEFLSAYASSIDEVLLMVDRDKNLMVREKVELMEDFLSEVDTIVQYRIKKAEYD